MKKQPPGAVVRFAIPLLCALSVLHSQTPAFAQSPALQVAQPAQSTQPIAVLSAAELDSLVAPIALYPDPLLSQILAASTYPLEIVEAAQWLRQNSTLTGGALEDAAKQQDWDASVQALVLFPDVLQRLSENIRWTTDLGNAFLAQQAGVMDAVQQMRSQALKSGALASTPQTVVTTQPQGATTIVEIQPANPQVIYVPIYDPAAIWGAGFYSYPVYGHSPVFISSRFVSFSAGVFVGSFFTGWNGWGGWGWRPNWFGRTVVVNNNFFNRYGYRTAWIGGGQAGPSIWRHDPVHRRILPNSNRVADARFRNDGGRSQGIRPPVGARQAGGVFTSRPSPNSPRSGARAFVPSSQGGSRFGPDTTFRQNREAPPTSAPRAFNQNRNFPGNPARTSRQPAQVLRNSPQSGPERSGDHFRSGGARNHGNRERSEGQGGRRN